MAFLVLMLIAVNVLLCISIALAVHRYGGDALVLALQGLREPRQRDAAQARRQRIEADENAWHFDR